MSPILLLLILSSPVIEMRTAAPDVAVVIVETAGEDPAPSSSPWDWTVGGVAPLAVGRWSYVWEEGLRDEGYPLILRHHVYLELPGPLVSGRRYPVVTPYGIRDWDFDDDVTPCESIKVNQEGYCGRSGVRYANLGIFLGDRGTRILPEPVLYEVREEGTGALVLQGGASYRGDDTGIDRGSGEHVYRLDLSKVPEGGPYHVRVIGFGRSHPFGVGKAWTEGVSYARGRGLYHQRCGMALAYPWTDHIRGPCHLTVEVTDADPPGFIEARGRPRSIRGGYHDAGDFDRRLSHLLIPAWMLNIYEAFPDRFTDGQLDIPESGNGIPDWLDEALWGVLLWEELQEPGGEVRAGTEADRHPSYGKVNAETDTLIYRTYRRDGAVTAIAAGIFAHASRMVDPFDGPRAADLLGRAVQAWKSGTGPRMYAALQLYLATGEPRYHEAFLQSVEECPDTYSPWPSLEETWGGSVISAYFFGYLITDRFVVADAQDRLRRVLEREAEAVLASLRERAYPMGPRTYVGFGSITNMGRYADPLLLLHRLTGEARYLDGASQLADYSLGLNPIGKCYTTGLGADPPRAPLHLDSYYTQSWNLGPVPGILVFGPAEKPSSGRHERLVWERVHPPWKELPEQRRYCEGWSQVRVQEFTTRMMALEACLSAFLDL